MKATTNNPAAPADFTDIRIGERVETCVNNLAGFPHVHVCWNIVERLTPAQIICRNEHGALSRFWRVDMTAGVRAGNCVGFDPIHNSYHLLRGRADDRKVSVFKSVDPAWPRFAAVRPNSDTLWFYSLEHANEYATLIRAGSFATAALFARERMVQ